MTGRLRPGRCQYLTSPPSLDTPAVAEKSVVVSRTLKLDRVSALDARTQAMDQIIARVVTIPTATSGPHGSTLLLPSHPALWPAATSSTPDALGDWKAPLSSRAVRPPPPPHQNQTVRLLPANVLAHYSVGVTICLTVWAGLNPVVQLRRR
jgi:hypothetical protein